MKLYYSPGSSSLPAHIALREAGLPFELERVSLKTKQTSAGVDFNTVNPKGYVPALRLDNGEVLTEGPVILQYIGDLAPDSGLVPRWGSMERYRLQEWLHFIASEVHKHYSTLFSASASPDSKQAARAQIERRLGYVENRLGSGPFLMGARFCAADCYLFTVLRWSQYVDIDLGRWPALGTYVDRVAAHPSVLAAMKEEGLIK